MTATQRDNIKQIEQGDPIWARIRRETRDTAAAEPILASFLHATILNHDELECALSFHLANLLGSPHRAGDDAARGHFRSTAR
jgi:serine O-acetyltransferase